MKLKRKTILALALMLLLAAAGTLLLVRQGVRLVCDADVRDASQAQDGSREDDQAPSHWLLTLMI